MCDKAVDRKEKFGYNKLKRNISVIFEKNST